MICWKQMGMYVQVQVLVVHIDMYIEGMLVRIIMIISLQELAEQFKQLQLHSTSEQEHLTLQGFQ